MSRRIRSLIQTHRSLSIAGLILVALAASLAGCDGDSPSEPSQPPGTPPGTAPSNATYSITVTVDPATVPAGSDDPVQVNVRVVRRDTGQPPPNGTTVVLAAGAGSFGALGGPTTIAAETINGQASVAFFPPDTLTTGTVVIQARLEDSIGQAQLRITEPATFFVASVEPNSGSPNGGDVVTITGGGFETPVRVTFGGVPAQVQSVSSNRIRVVTPPSPETVPVGGTATVPVSVTINLNEEEQATDVLPSAFIYARGGTVIQPQVFSISPASGPNEGGTRVTIVGEGFQAPVQVFFGDGSSAGDFTGLEATVLSVTANQIVVEAPAAQGFGQDNRNSNVDILVRNLETGSATVAPAAFLYGVGLTINAVQPNEVPEVPGSGDLVTIFGQGFEAPVVVQVGDVQQEVISVTATEIVFRPQPFAGEIPCGSRVNGGPVSVRLVNANEQVTGQSLFYLGPERFIITGVSPTSGDEDGGFAVIVTGQNFEDPVRVSFQGPAGSATVSGSVDAGGTRVMATAPDFTGKLVVDQCDDNGDGEEGERFLPTTVDIVVSNPVTGCTDTLPSGFTFEPDDESCRGDIAPVDPDPVQCQDGFDNDGDGMTDAADPQCTGPTDDDESA